MNESGIPMQTIGISTLTRTLTKTNGRLPMLDNGTTTKADTISKVLISIPACNIFKKNLFIFYNFHAFYFSFIKSVNVLHYTIKENIFLQVFCYLMNFHFYLAIFLFYRNRIYFRVYLLPLSCPIFSHLFMTCNISTFPTIWPMHIGMHQ